MAPTTNRPTSKKVRVAIAGVGNCASSLVQGVEYYRDADPTDEVPGLMHVDLGGYHVGDVEFVAAFDVRSTGSASSTATRSKSRRRSPSTSRRSSVTPTRTSW
jgi:hypothetical protein